MRYSQNAVIDWTGGVRDDHDFLSNSPELTQLLSEWHELDYRMQDNLERSHSTYLPFSIRQPIAFIIDSVGLSRLGYWVFCSRVRSLSL